MTTLNETLPGAVQAVIEKAAPPQFVCSAPLPKGKGTVKGLCFSAAKKILLQDMPFETACFGLLPSEKTYVETFVREYRQYLDALKSIEEAG